MCPVRSWRVRKGVHTARARSPSRSSSAFPPCTPGSPAVHGNLCYVHPERRSQRGPLRLPHESRGLHLAVVGEHSEHACPPPRCPIPELQTHPRKSQQFPCSSLFRTDSHKSHEFRDRDGEKAVSQHERAFSGAGWSDGPQSPVARTSPHTPQRAPRLWRPDRLKARRDGPLP